MPAELVVKTAQAKLEPAVPTVTIVTMMHTLSVATSGPFVSSMSNEVLLEADVDASFASYTTPYNSAAYLGGTLKYQSLKSTSQLSTLVKKDGKEVVTKSTTGVIACSVMVPAMQPNPPGPPIPDSNISYDLKFSILQTGQQLATAD